MASVKHVSVRRYRGATIVVTTLFVLAGCTAEPADPGSGEGSTATPTIADASVAPSASSTPGPFDGLASPPPPAGEKVPPITTVEAAGGQTIPATGGDADWTLVTEGIAWVTGLGGGMARFEAATGRQLSPVKIPEGPCAAAAADFGFVWTATCGKSGIAKIDPSGAIEAWVPIPQLAINHGESTIGAGEGAVWALEDLVGDGSCRGCGLVRIDPKRAEIEDRYEIPPGATAVRAGLGGVWIVYSDENAVLRIDPDTGEVVAAIGVGPFPLFFDVGEGGVWVMNQLDGSVSRIDPDTNEVEATIAV
ncbi:MAG TPA: hypothetical protein VI341_08155, partial [Actinomycetota bacterium]